MRHEMRSGARRIGAVLSLAILPLIAAGCGQGQSGSAAAPPPVPEVGTVEIKAERLVLTTELPGRTSPYSIAEIRPQVGGIIQKRLFEEGTEIKAGQALYQIDPAPLQAAQDSAAANLAAARKAVDRARAALEAGHAGVARQRAVLVNAETNRRRFEALAAEGAVSASQRDQAVTEADVAQATLRTAEAQVESDRQAVAAAEAAVQQAEAALQSARINLGYTRVTAPIAGRIGKSMVTVGALVTASQPTALATIQQLDPIYVDVAQSSANLLRLRQSLASGKLKGDGPDRARVRLLLEDGTPYPVEGTLKFSDVTVDPSTGSYTLRTVFSNARRILLPGMYVRAVVQEGIAEQAILVPQQAVSRDPRGAALAMVVDRDGKVEQRSVRLDREVGARWLIAEGLKPGDQLIVEGFQRARPGATVNAKPVAPQITPAAAAPATAK